MEVPQKTYVPCSKKARLVVLVPVTIYCQQLLNTCVSERNVETCGGLMPRIHEEREMSANVVVDLLPLHYNKIRRCWGYGCFCSALYLPGHFGSDQKSILFLKKLRSIRM
jgi:hypothetical protein